MLPHMLQAGGRYLIQEELGRGGMGVVYRAFDRLTTQDVALKCMTVPTTQLEFATRTLVSSSHDIHLALAQEFRLLASLRHPHIISVLDYGFYSESPGGRRWPFYTMELLEHAQDILDCGIGQSVEFQVPLLVQTAQALAYLHRRGIIHRDLKPANVLVTMRGVKLLDFGIAALREQDTTQLVGTLGYIAPEILSHRVTSEASDLYALGVIAYELFTASSPFDRKDTIALINDTLTRTPDAALLHNAVQYNDALTAVVMRLLERDPRVRYQDANEVIRDLCHAIGQEPPPETNAIRESFLQAASFAGRRQELALLQNALDDALEGRGSAWLISGESGVGKSRLLEELRSRALVLGALVMRGQATAEGGGAYHMWRDPLRRLALSESVAAVEPIDPADASALKLLVPDLDTLLNIPIPDAPEADRKAIRQRLVPAITNAFYRQRHPIVLLLDDLQWAGKSLEPIQHLSQIIFNLPLLIIGAYRDDERPVLPEELAELQVIKLTRFSEAEIAQISEAMLGEAGRLAPVVQLLQKESEGNAYFLVEVARALAEEAGGLGGVGRATLPESVFAGGVEQVVRRRLNRVPESERGLLKIAAVIGRSIDLPVLEALDAEIDLDDWLLKCADAVVLEVVDGAWQFAHDKLREALLTDLTPQERPRIYRMVAEAFEYVYPNDPLRAALLASFWREAGDRGRELHYAVLAGEHALSVSNLREALAMFRRALALVTSSGQMHLRAALMLRLGETHTLMGQFTEALDVLENAASLVRELNSDELLADALYHISQVAIKQGELTRSKALLKESLNLAYQAKAQPALVRAYYGLGDTAWHMGNLKEARAYLEEGLKIAYRMNARAHMPLLLNRLALVLSAVGDYAHAREMVEQGFVLARESGNRERRAALLLTLGDIERHEGHYREASECFQESLALHQSIGSQHGVGFALLYLARVRMELGDSVGAVPLLHQALDTALALHAIALTLNALIGFARLFMLAADDEAALGLLGLALNHPGADSFVLIEAEPLLNELKAHHLPDVIERELVRGKDLDLQAVVRWLIREHAL